MILVLALVFLNIGCDQISKEVARKKIDDREIISVVDQKFILTKVENTGAAMSMGENFSPTLKTILLKVFPSVMLVVMLVVVLFKKDISKLSTVGWAFIIGGGVGNIYDRVLYNSVTDFMHIDLGGIFKTGVFNMADVSVVIGTLLVVTQALLSRRKLKETPAV